MPAKYDESLFEHTKMSFGEHLEELRGTLFKSVVALTVGFLIGLLFANRFVDYVQTPLKEALGNYYLDQEKARFIEELQNSGGLVPEDLEAAEAWTKQELITEERWISTQQLAELLVQLFPNLQMPSEEAVVSDENAGPRSNSDIPAGYVELKLYHKLANDPRLRVIATGSQDPFMILMKAALVLGAVISSPFIFYFVWQFVAAGLYPHEKHYIHVFLPISLGLFLAGALLAFFGVIPFVLDFLLSFFSWMGIHPELRITEWLSFVMILPVGFGIAFQLPLVMMFLERIGIFTVESYLSKWRIAILVIFVLSMFLTPADPWSLILMAVPLTALYFGGILLCKWMPRRTTPFGEMIE